MPQKTLVIAEKPSVARDIARVLGCRERLDGAIGGKDYIVSWALGHLVTLCEPDELNPEYKKWRMDQLPILPDTMKTKVIPKTRSQFSALKKLMLSAEVERIICATDSGREGELIFRYIYHQAKCKKPVDRLWISSMTDQAIRTGLQSMRPDSLYDPLYMSARCRAEADWLVGMNASRAFTLRYNALLSLGRVQTPTLNLIVTRDREIAAFVPVDYTEVRADFGDYQGLWLNPEKNELRCYDHELALQIKKQLPKKPAKVIESVREQKKTAPPPLFDLTALQREANHMMGLPAAKTLSLAQSLYEKHKLITYPRTDSRYLPKDMIGQVKKTLRALPAPYAQLAEPIYDAPTPFGRVINDKKVSDHHAIIPTGHKYDLSKLSDPERRLFDMIARRLIAVHYPDYEYESVQVKTQAEQHVFKTEGATPVVMGWRALYTSDSPAKSEEPKVPKLSVGDNRTVESISLKKQKTKPPAPHTDASLLMMMERAGRLIEDEELAESMKDSGLGTPATRAAIIERLVKVGYIKRSGKAILSTEKGQRLIQVAPAEIASPELTGKWEKALSTMAKPHTADELEQLSSRFMDSIRRYAAFLVESGKTAPTDVQFEREQKKGSKKYPPKAVHLGKPCPICHQGEVTMNQKAFGCSRWKEGCKYTVWINTLERAGGPTLNQQMMQTLLDGQPVERKNATITMENGQPQLHKK
ncbi:DNA topoisomerase III [Eubacteriales bacterium OttesenSCG-928-N13]|nr:DNA topoisomerase III [Eubacteriales bacterium OttesenSCG-928-N13]